MDIHWIWWQYAQRGEFGLGTLFTLWIPLLQSLGIPLTMLPIYWLTLGSLYLTFIAIGTPFAIVGSILGKITFSCLVISIGLTPLDILIPWVTTSCSTT